MPFSHAAAAPSIRAHLPLSYVPAFSKGFRISERSRTDTLDCIYTQNKIKRAEYVSNKMKRAEYVSTHKHTWSGTIDLTVQETGRGAAGWQRDAQRCSGATLQVICSTRDC